MDKPNLLCFYIQVLLLGLLIFNDYCQGKTVNYGANSDFQAMQVSIAGNRILNKDEKIRWNSVDINEGDLFHVLDHTLNPTSSAIFFISKTFKGKGFGRIELYKDGMMTYAHVDSSTVSSNTGLTRNAADSYLFKENLSDCELEGSTDGKENAWIAFPVTYGNYFFAYTRGSQDHVGSFRYSILDPVKGFENNGANTAVKATKTGIYYVNYAIRNYRHVFEWSFAKNGQQIQHTKINRNVYAQSFTDISLGTIVHLNASEELSLKTRDTSRAETMFPNGKLSYLMGIQLNEEFPYFLAHGSPTKCSTGSSFEKLNYTNIEFDNRNSWNSEKQSYRASSPGIYYINLNIPVKPSRLMTANVMINDKKWMSLRRTLPLKGDSSNTYNPSRGGLMKLRPFDEISVEFNGCVESTDQSTVLTIFYLPNQS